MHIKRSAGQVAAWAEKRMGLIEKKEGGPQENAGSGISCTGEQKERDLCRSQLLHNQLKGGLRARADRDESLAPATAVWVDCQPVDSPGAKDM